MRPYATSEWARALALCGAFIVAQSARPCDAQVGWSDAALLPGAGWQAAQAQVAVDGAGTPTAVWTNCDPSCAIVAARATGATWRPATIATPIDGSVLQLRLVADAAVTATVVWIEQALDGRMLLRVMRSVGLSDAWTTPVTLAERASVTGAPGLATDGAGNVFVTWNAQALDWTFTVQASRFDVQAGTWATPITVGAENAHGASVAASRDGDAVVVWSLYGGGMRSARYRALQGTWSETMVIAQQGPASGQSVTPVVIDPDGNALTVWTGWTSGAATLYAARLASGSDTWTAPEIAAPQGAMGPYPALTADAAGNLTVAALTYQFGGTSPHVVNAVRYVAAIGAWTSPVAIGNADSGLTLSADQAGRVFAAWQRFDLVDNLALIESAVFDSATGRWHPLRTFSWPGVFACCPALAAAGQSTLLWSVSGYGLNAVQYARWSSLLGPPTIYRVAPSPGAVTLSVILRSSPVADLAPANYEISLDDGLTWTPRVPASPDSPITVSGLVDGTRYTVRLRAVNVAGAGQTSRPMTVTSGGGPETPSGLVVTEVAGRQVTLAWNPPVTGMVPTEYVVEGGVLPGQTLATLATGSDTPGFTFIAPSGAFYIRVRAASGTLRSAPSNEVPLFVEAPLAPSAPASLLEAANGADLLLSWTPTFGGGTPMGYVLTVTGDISVTLALPVSERFRFAGVPHGTYTFTVAARNEYGTSPPSNPVTLTFPASCIDGPLPGTPTSFRVTKTGTTLTVHWEPPVTGRAVSGYRLFVDGLVVGGGPWVFDLPTTSRVLSGIVPAGTYALRVAGENACFVGESTRTITALVP